MLKNYDKHDSVQYNKCFWKESLFGMVWYAMLCYPMLWYSMESMLSYEISMLCYEISMLFYAMVYFVKDKHSATVCNTLTKEIYKGHIYAILISYLH